MTDHSVSGKNIILGITGGIAAYKAAELCSLLVKHGADVHVVMTEHATRFVGPATFRALTGRQVITSMWDEPREYEIAHVSLPDKADLMMIVPATANIIGKIASGIADDMLSTMVTATTAPVLLAPAMNCRMWDNPIIQSNVTLLESLGYEFVYPEGGRLACGTVGVGRLASTAAIYRRACEILSARHDLEGVSILVTAGPTQEPIDPVRFIMNRSSGKMGYAIAQAAADRGARVVLVSGPTVLADPVGVDVVHVRTAAQMLDAAMTRLPDMQAIIGAAAPADFTPKSPEPNKIKKTGAGMTIELTTTADIIAEVGRQKGDRIVVAFAAETEDLLANARAKIEKKNADFIVANDVSQPGIGFGSEDNEVTIISRDGSIQEIPKTSKRAVANMILDRVRDLLNVKS